MSRVLSPVLPILLLFSALSMMSTAFSDEIEPPSQASSPDTNAPPIGTFARETLRLAAQNIVRKVQPGETEDVLLVFSEGKRDIATWILHEMETQGIDHTSLMLSAETPDTRQRIQTAIVHRHAGRGLILLIDPADAAFLFEVIGRPDTGIKVPTEHFFCDWLMDTESLVRLYGEDPVELGHFREALLKAVRDADKIRITTKAGTDITLTPRSWITADGEIFTCPVEYESNGVIVVDGCAYYGPPETVFTLKVADGRVTNTGDLDTENRQQSWVVRDLTRDENSNVLAELGIGTAANSRWYAGLMESETARGTCHFGFGNNRNFEGGRNESGYHFDLVIRRPTIHVNGTCVCKNGDYLFE